MSRHRRVSGADVVALTSLLRRNGDVSGAHFSSVISRRQDSAEAGNVAVETRVRARLGHEIAVVVEDQAPPIDVQYPSS
jgi:hypothetical protein